MWGAVKRRIENDSKTFGLSNHFKNANVSRNDTFLFKFT